MMDVDMGMQYCLLKHIRKNEFSTIIRNGFSWTIRTFEWTTSLFRNLRDGMLAQDMPTWHQHWRIVDCALIFRNRTRKNRMKLKLSPKLHFQRQLRALLNIVSTA